MNIKTKLKIFVALLISFNSVFVLNALAGDNYNDGYHDYGYEEYGYGVYPRSNFQEWQEFIRKRDEIRNLRQMPYRPTFDMDFERRQWAREKNNAQGDFYPYNYYYPGNGGHCNSGNHCGNGDNHNDDNNNYSYWPY